MIPKRFHFYTFAFFMSLFMSGFMSLTMLALTSETLNGVILRWLEAWGISMIVAFPVSILVVPITQKIVSKIITAN